eukprot:1176544-Prorocentrum_minimum.AAC.2
MLIYWKIVSDVSDVSDVRADKNVQQCAAHDPLITCAGSGGCLAQNAAADAVANMCTDMHIINAVVREEGLWSVVAMSQSPNRIVQRHAARAFLHLVREENSLENSVFPSDEMA